LGATVSVKLSQLGIGLDPAVCVAHLDELLRAAAEVGVLVEVDMEHSSVGPATLEAFRAVLLSSTSVSWLRPGRASTSWNGSADAG
jgi:proline dehydrogenase